MFVGREAYLIELEKAIEMWPNGVLLISGPPMIGKTELVTQLFVGKKGYYYFSKSTTEKEQLRLFSEKITGDPTSLNTWDQCFSYLAAFPTDEQHLLIIDEFQMIQKGCKDFLESLKRQWETQLKHKNWMICLVTSSSMFLTKEFFNQKSQYEQMICKHYIIEQLPYIALRDFYPTLNTVEWVQIYSLLGGNPYLLGKWQVEHSLEENIKNNLLAKESGFHYLAEAIIYKELRETQVYITLMAYIAKGDNRLIDLYEKTEIDKNKLAVYLKNLIALGFVEREYANEKYESNGQSYSGVYKIAQSYMQFYFQCIYPHLNELEVGDIEGVYQYEVSPQLAEIYEQGFKAIGLHYVRQLNDCKKLPTRYLTLGKWWRKDVAFDLIGYGLKNEVFIGQCLFEDTPERIIETIEQMRKQGGRYFKNQKVNYYLITKNTVNTELIKKHDPTHQVTLIQLSQMFEI